MNTKYIEQLRRLEDWYYLDKLIYNSNHKFKPLEVYLVRRKRMTSSNTINCVVSEKEGYTRKPLIINHFGLLELNR